MVPASVPDPVHNCSVWHEASAEGVVVACEPGWNGGMKQTFSLEVRESADEEALAALTSQPIPHFIVTGLLPGTEYLLAVSANNSQGLAPIVNLNYVTPIDIAEKRLSADAASENGSSKNSDTVNNNTVKEILIIVFGVVGGVIFCVIAVLVAIKVHSLVRASGHGKAKVTYRRTPSEPAEENEVHIHPDAMHPAIGKFMYNWNHKCLYKNIMYKIGFAIFHSLYL